MLVKRDSLYHVAKEAEVNVAIIRLKSEENLPSQERFLSVFDDKEETAKLKAGVDVVSRWVHRGELASLVFLGVSFIWLLVGPFILKC